MAGQPPPPPPLMTGVRPLCGSCGLHVRQFPLPSGGSRGLPCLCSEWGLTDSLSLRVALEENPDRHCPVPMPSSCRSASTCRAGSVLVGGSWESRVSPAGVLLPLGSGWNPACPQRPVLFLSLRGRRMILPEVFSFSFN